VTQEGKYDFSVSISNMAFVMDENTDEMRRKRVSKKFEWRAIET
jgi:hypothetical protein